MLLKDYNDFTNILVIDESGFSSKL